MSYVTNPDIVSIHRNGLDPEFLDYIEKCVFAGKGKDAGLDNVRVAISYCFLMKGINETNLVQINKEDNDILNSLDTVADIKDHINKYFNQAIESRIINTLSHNFNTVIRDTVLEAKISMYGGVSKTFYNDQKANIYKTLTPLNPKILFNDNSFSFSSSNIERFLQILNDVNDSVLSTLVKKLLIKSISNLLKLYDAGCISDYYRFNDFVYTDPIHSNQLEEIEKDYKGEPKYGNKVVKYIIDNLK